MTFYGGLRQILALKAADFIMEQLKWTAHPHANLPMHDKTVNLFGVALLDTLAILTSVIPFS